jgi:hypothetical protein
MFNCVPIKHNQMSFVPNGGKFKIYTVLNGLIFPTPTQPRISFERAYKISEDFISMYLFLMVKCGATLVSVISDKTKIIKIVSSNHQS